MVLLFIKALETTATFQRQNPKKVQNNTSYNCVCNVCVVTTRLVYNYYNINKKYPECSHANL
jgi:hypothetical protein